MTDSLDEGEYFFVFQDGVSLLGMIKYALNKLGVGLDSASFQPEYDVGLAAHRPDLYLLFAAKHSGGYPGVDGIGQPLIALLECLDDGGRVNAGRRSEGVAPYDGIGDRDWDTGGAACSLAIAHQVGKVVVDVTHQLQVDQELVHRRVADALADTQRGPVEPVRAGFECRYCVDDSEASVLVAVPVYLNVLAAFGHNRLDPVEQSANAIRRGMPDGITHTDAAGAGFACGQVTGPQRIKGRPGRCFRF